MRGMQDSPRLDQMSGSDNQRQGDQNMNFVMPYKSQNVAPVC